MNQKKSNRAFWMHGKKHSPAHGKVTDFKTFLLVGQKSPQMVVHGWFTMVESVKTTSLKNKQK